MKKFKSVLAMSLASTLLLSGINPIPVSASGVGISGVEDGGYYKTVPLTVGGTDSVSKIAVGKNGVLTTYDGVSSVKIEDEYDDNGNLVFNCEGHWTVRVYGTDGSVNSADFTIDRQVPKANGINTKSNNNNVSVKLKNGTKYNIRFTDEYLDKVKIDDGLGNATGSWRNKNSADLDSQGYLDVSSDEYQYAIDGLTNRTVTCYAKDLAGNTTSFKLQYMNLQPPKFTNIKNGDAFNKGIKIGVNQSDATIKVDGKKWNKNDYLIDEGSHKITALGEYGSTTVKIKIDLTKPETTIKSGTRYKVGKKTLTSSCFSDNLSGVDVKNTTLKRGNTTINNFKESITVKHKDDSTDTIWRFKKYNLKEKGSYTLTLKDKAGNKRTVKFKVVK